MRQGIHISWTEYLKGFFLMAFLLPFGIIITKSQISSDPDLTKLIDIKKQNAAQSVLFADSLFLYLESIEPLKEGLIRKIKGDALAEMNQYYPAKENYDRAIELIDETDAPVAYIDLLVASAKTNVYLSNISLANDQAIEAMRIAFDFNKENSLPDVYNVISFLYYTIKDYERAMDFLELSQEIQIRNQDTIGLSETYNNIAILYKHMKLYDRSLTNHFKSLELNKDLSISHGIAKSYNNIGQVYAETKDFELAIEYTLMAIETNQKALLNNTTAIRNLAELYKLIKDYKLSKAYYELALEMEKENGITNTLIAIYENLKELSIISHDDSLTIFYGQRIDSLVKVKDQKNKEEKIQMIENQFRLFYNKQKLEQAESEALLSQLFIAILVLVVLFLAVVFYQRNRLIKLRATREKHQLELKILRNQMNPHFIHNTLSVIQNKLLENDPIQIAASLSRFSKLIRQNFEFAAKDLITLSDDIEALENYLETQLMRFENKFKYKIEVDESLEQELIKIPPLMIQPLVENSINHGFKNLTQENHIAINIKKSGYAELTITVEDNGIGYHPKSDKNLHSLDILKRRLQLIGTGNQKSLYIGNRKQGQGTEVKFKIPFSV